MIPNETFGAFASPELDYLFLPPTRVGSASSWWGHVPFAQWLVSELRPRLIVELGTQNGVSFAAFCNAVQHAGLPTRCFAIDTWEGDEHSGKYDASVYDNVVEFNARRFASFATLIRGTFEEALPTFDDGSTDLLHIDGFHTYDAVKHDFETWHPKVSSRGVVLLHDIAVRDRDFGVWRFWDEIRSRYPSFAFNHSAGLGVLAVGADVPKVVQDMVELDEARSIALRQRMSDLGERWISTDERHRATAERELSNATARTKTDENLKLRADMALLSETADLARDSVASHMQEISMLRLQLAAVSSDADNMRRRLEQVRTSTSWRITGPYRIAGRFIKQRLIGPISGLQRFKDYRVISKAKLFYPEFYLGRATTIADGDPMLDYLAASEKAAPRARPSVGAPQRRPTPGFHPLMYAESNRAYTESSGEDPLAHYIRTGKPAGAWAHEVIHADHPIPAAAQRSRVAIHCHFHYPEFLSDFIRRLRTNASKPDLFITTTSETKRKDILSTLEIFGESAKMVEVVPNRGRDIGPMLIKFQDFEAYDVVGHIHGKRSPQAAQPYGDNWRQFLWEHLIGGDYPAMDVIVRAFADDPALGLVFPEDPNLNDWDINREHGDALGLRMGLGKLRQHFEFPKGTMFWVRPAALRPLVDLGWTWDSFPEEPLPLDGTVLHALERMMTFAAEKVGLGYKTTHVPTSLRL